ncbi:class I adenylate-forming enzyme family protein [Bordetella bronchiseptica]|uniref:Long-chain-fatty-acid-CoA ligase n=1 Tax=Bordetella bronchiseptica (strain ATCC BAA-588 / NCTC 13252 / RB50) TaxID=257310 RepID=A0A0H3LIH8_BORBR|nr:class I adenylate-forming enzyme family protein [Bordetella bronchiseptica]AUV49766.1 long-chain fatty acid--CoA ligase [Bordetella bronchiseptica]AWP78672.1 long-chain fatty acid--CoA ligase [Bordetella bronchiseptica]AWP83488.1 long-chain fatty acid--CoA ligase [Bordetella bronchiseptica]AWQ09055.1 long-chain fatty acid--CoA ligase [Bordetella bronchiseptica]AXT90567.1 long-chain fatty acid--CoA ligase [Bordetella bronchiseptica]
MDIRDIKPAGPTWLDVVGQHAAATPERTALGLDGHTLSYSRLLAVVDEAAALLARLGVRRGDRVALLSPPRPEAIITFLACTRLGAVWLALNPKYKAPEIHYILDHARPTLLMSVREFDNTEYVQTVEQVVAGIGRDSGHAIATVFFGREQPTHDDLFAALRGAAQERGGDAALPGPAAAQPGQACMLVYTSGSTGRPKGVLLAEFASLFRATVQKDYFATSRPPCILNFSPINHVGGMQFRSLVQLAAGGTIHFQERFQPGETLALIRRHRINMLMLGPTMLNMLMAHPDFDVDIFRQLEWYISAGAALPVPALKLLAANCPRVGSVYGSTESCSTVTYASLDDSFDAVAYSIGRPIPGDEMRVADAQGEPAGPGIEGELQIRRRYCMVGYLNDPAATRAAFTEDGWYRTGDLATLLPDGSFKLAGRIKEMFKSGGYNVYPREVELALESHPEVKMAAVVAVDDPMFQQVGHAYVLVEPRTALTAGQLTAWSKERLANYKVPKRIELRTALPMLAIGKVDKVALQAAAARDAAVAAAG